MGVPTTQGNAHLGKSSPENPALQTPDPLSMITGVPIYEDMFSILIINGKENFLDLNEKNSEFR